MVLGVSPPVLLESTAKRLIEAIAGRGGLESICQFLDQLDWLPAEAKAMRLSIKANTVFFEAALSMCSKDMMKRPYGVRYHEISEFVGATCPSCGFNTALSMVKDYGKRCPTCQVKLKPAYMISLTQLVKDKKVKATPEAVLMNYAYDLLGQAYVDAYKALSLALSTLAQGFGWGDRFRVEHRLLNYFHSYFYGRLAGEQKISREEKECLQFIVRGNLALIPFEDAEKLLRLGIDVVKYGYLFEVLRAVGAQVHYSKSVAAFNMLYDALNTTIRERLHETSAQLIRRFRVKKTIRGSYVPCMRVPKESWQTGQLEGEVLLEPVTLPIFPKADMGAIQTVYGRLGSGKTFLLSSLILLRVSR
jgi:aryl carrier-like protein